MSKRIQNTSKVLGLDISTKTIGFALFDKEKVELLELTHFSPKVKPKPEHKIEELMTKATIFGEKLKTYVDMGVEDVIIEQPLLNSNNVYTVGILMQYNTLISKEVYDILGVTPKYISTYNSRKWAFPELYTENKNGKVVLFGDYPKGCDKKQIIWEKVAEREPQIVWHYTRNNTLKKENYDMTDAYTCVIGYLNNLNNID